MGTIQYLYGPAVQEPQLIAAFANPSAARVAVEDLNSLPVQADLIVTPPIGEPAGLQEKNRSNAIASGAMIGFVGGLLVAALIINFLLVTPGVVSVLGVVLFGAVGGVTIGGLIAGVGIDERETRPRPTVDADAQAFVTVHADDPEQIEAAQWVLRRRHALDIYQA
jgi:hypothetical protein